MVCTYLHRCSQGSAVLGIQHSYTLASVQHILCWCICCYSVAVSLYDQLIVLTHLYSHTYIQTELWSAPPSLSQVPLPLCHKCPSPSITSVPPSMPLPSGRALFAGSSTLNQIERIIHFLPPPTRGDMDSLKSPYAQSLLRQVPRR